MIKVNLLKTKVSSGEQGFDNATSFGTTFGDEPTDEVSVPLKLLVMAIFTGVLVLYENYNLGQLTDKKNVVESQLASVQQQVTGLQEQVNEANRYKEQISEVEKKMVVLKQLSKVRMIELKALDFLQSIIPDRVWLDTIAFDGTNFKFRGFAVGDEDLTDFLKRLESRSYFSNVILLQATEAKTPQGTVKSFEIRAKLESV